MRRARTVAGWTVVTFMLPYLTLKVLWIAGVPVGVTDHALMAAVLTLVAGTGPDVAAGPIRPWVYAMVYTGFAGQGIALAVVFVLYVGDRWGAPLRGRAAGMPGGPAGRLRSRLAWIAAGLAAMVAAVNAYWAFGGDAGLPRGMTGLAFRANNALLAVLAVVTAVGLLMLVRRSRVWLAAALTWIGTGALCWTGTWIILGTQLATAFGVPARDRGGIDVVDVVRVLAGALAAVVAVRVLAGRDRTPTTLTLHG